MQEPTEPVKTHVTPENLATITCPFCKMARTISVAQFREGKHELKIKCKCGKHFKLKLEFRRSYRKETDLDGTYEATDHTTGGIVKIHDLSLGGARFEVRGVHDIQPGNKGSLVFTLSDRNATVIAKDVTIKSVRGNEIGCEFADTQAYDRDLGFYLMP